MPASVRRSVLVLLVSASSAAACGGRIEAVVRAQAALDLSCPESQVTVRDRRSRTEMRDYEVAGCGRERSYQAACNSLGTCVAYPVRDQAGGGGGSHGIDLWADHAASPEAAPASPPAPEIPGVAGAADISAVAAALAADGAAEAPVANGAADVPAADVPAADGAADVPVTDGPATDRVAAVPVKAPLGEVRAVTLRNDCERTVALFIGEDPAQGAGRYTSLGSTNMSTLKLRQGEPVWLLDPKGAGLASIVPGRDISEISVLEGCAGFSAR